MLIRDLMTPNPLTLSSASTVQQAGAAMREADVGDIIVVNGEAARGIVTDRDIVVRAVADGLDMNATLLGEICSADMVTVSPADEVDLAVALMKEHAVRRLPVVDDGRAVGIVSLGDIALLRDPASSALAQISAAPPNT